MSNGRSEELLSWIKLVVTAFAIAFLLKTFVFQIAYVKGSSMEPTLHEGEVLVISKVGNFIGGPKRGQVIVLSDQLEHKDLIKRIIGLPGEEIEILEGRILIDGVELAKDYSEAETEDFGFMKSIVEEQSYFVLGDNRPYSRDSRFDTVGFVKRKNILGRAVFRLWPLSKIGVVK